MELSRASESVSVYGQISKETAKAILVKKVVMPDDSEGEDMWFPFSHVKEIHRDGSPLDSQPHIVVSRWIAEKKGLV